MVFANVKSANFAQLLYLSSPGDILAGVGGLEEGNQLVNAPTRLLGHQVAGLLRDVVHHRLYNT
jgi:hypothetical protein